MTDDTDPDASLSSAAMPDLSGLRDDVWDIEVSEMSPEMIEHKAALIGRISRETLIYIPPRRHIEILLTAVATVTAQRDEAVAALSNVGGAYNIWLIERDDLRDGIDELLADFESERDDHDGTDLNNFYTDMSRTEVINRLRTLIGDG